MLGIGFLASALTHCLATFCFLHFVFFVAVILLGLIAGFTGIIQKEKKHHTIYFPLNSTYRWVVVGVLLAVVHVFYQGVATLIAVFCGP